MLCNCGRFRFSVRVIYGRLKNMYQARKTLGFLILFNPPAVVLSTIVYKKRKTDGSRLFSYFYVRAVYHQLT